MFFHLVLSNFLDLGFKMNKTLTYFIDHLIEPVLLVQNKTIVFANKAAQDLLKLHKNNATEKVERYIHEKKLKKRWVEDTFKSLTDKYLTTEATYAEIVWYIMPFSLDHRHDCFAFIGKASENVKTQAYISSLKNELKNILNCTPGKIYWKDLESRYRGANKELLDFLGLSDVSQIIGKRDEDFFGDQAESLREHDRWVIENKETLVKEESIQLSSGERRYFIATKMPRYDDDQVIGVMGNSIDITDRKMIEHDLRVRADSVQEAMEYLAKYTTDPKLKEVAEKGLSATEEFSKLMDEMVNIDRV